MNVHYQDYLGQWRLWLSFLNDARVDPLTEFYGELARIKLKSMSCIYLIRGIVKEEPVKK
jgi:hypothetical protein